MRQHHNFQPTGDRARWRVLYDLLLTLEPGELCTYEDMAGALGLDYEADRTKLIPPFQRAAKELEANQKRAVRLVRGIGYRVAKPEEHLVLAQAHQKRARIEVERAHSKVTNVDLSQMDPETRKGFELVRLALSMQGEFMRRMDVRQEQLAQAVEAVATDQRITRDEVAELRERMRQLEARTSGASSHIGTAGNTGVTG